MGRDSREALARQMRSGILKILGIEIDGRMVGAVVTTHDSRKGWINRLAVDPDFRRQGYGNRLLAAAEEVLVKQGIQIIAALIEGDNPVSLEMFKQAGYQEIDSRMHYVSKRENPDV
jgi:ribosomal protein S18 acetylase RimI-like enzyme